MPLCLSKFLLSFSSKFVCGQVLSVLFLLLSIYLVILSNMSCSFSVSSLREGFKFHPVVHGICSVRIFTSTWPYQLLQQDIRKQNTFMLTLAAFTLTKRSSDVKFVAGTPFMQSTMSGTERSPQPYIAESCLAWLSRSTELWCIPQYDSRGPLFSTTWCSRPVQGPEDILFFGACFPYSQSRHFRVIFYTSQHSVFLMMYKCTHLLLRVIMIEGLHWKPQCQIHRLSLYLGRHQRPGCFRWPISRPPLDLGSHCWQADSHPSLLENLTFQYDC